MTSVNEQIARWFTIAKPEPTSQDLNTQYGVHIEEFGEMLDALVTTSDEANEFLNEYKKLTHTLADALKTGQIFIDHEQVDRLELLDSICDQIVTGIGIAIFNSLNVHGALQEVADSNDSKFVDGKPIFNENGKISKGPNYKRPNLVDYV